MRYSAASLLIATMRRLILTLLFVLLPLQAWACMDMAASAPLASAHQTIAAQSADGAVQQAQAHHDTADGAAVSTSQAACDNCQSCSQCHTPALAPFWRLAVALPLPQSLQQLGAATFSSATTLRGLKPPIA